MTNKTYLNFIFFIFFTFFLLNLCNSQIKCISYPNDSICINKDSFATPYFYAHYLKDTLSGKWYLFATLRNIDKTKQEILQYYPTGVLKIQEMTNGSELIGNRFKYSSDGKILSIMILSDDHTQNNVYIDFHKNGTVNEVSRAFEQQLIGTKETYFANGRLASESEYKMVYMHINTKVPLRYKKQLENKLRIGSNWVSFETGNWRSWDEFGNLIQNDVYIDGILQK